MMKIATMSDVHGKYHDLNPPEADLLIMAGDLLPNFGYSGSDDALMQWAYLDKHFNPMLQKWKDEGRYREIIVVAGNHDWVFERENSRARKCLTAAVYLQDELFEFENIKIWGSPWQPHFCDWAFNFPNHYLNFQRARDHARACWNMIPDDIDLLVTHGPPLYILDGTQQGLNVGCQFLRERIDELAKLRMHVFGHIHYSYGQKEVDGALFVNAAVCGENYKPENPAQVFDWDKLLEVEKR